MSKGGTWVPAAEALGVAVAANVPVLLWGAPGTGKSTAIAAMARDAGWQCTTVIASIREPSDFAGLPVVRDSGVEFAPPRWALELVESDRAVLFFDEISTTPPAVQAALLRVVLERVVGDLKLPPGVAIVAAGNPADQTSSGWDLTAPLSNRFCHLDWQHDPAVFVEGVVHGWRSPPLPSLSDDWEAGIALNRALVASFIKAHPTALLSVPPTIAQSSYAWPSPRTWEMAARLLTAAASARSRTETANALLIGAVGLAHASEFLVWRDNLDLLDPEEVLEDPTGVALPARLDISYATLLAVATAVSNVPTAERWVSAWRFVARYANHAPDVALPAARLLAQCRPEGVDLPAEIDVFMPALE